MVANRSLLVVSDWRTAKTGRMNGEARDESEGSSRGAVWVWLCWLGGILVLYILSVGPVMLMQEKKLLRFGTSEWRVVQVVYWPVELACEEDSFFRKPFFMYLHLWAPGRFDSKGNIKR